MIDKFSKLTSQSDDRLEVFPNQYSTEIILAACSPLLGVGFGFGFLATYVRVVNLAAVPIHVQFTSTGPATTDDPELRPGMDFTLTEIRCFGGGVSTTSTTTSTADGVSHRVTVAAFGG